MDFDWEKSTSKEVGNYIQSIREKVGWSISDLEKILHVRRRTVTRWLSGEVKAQYMAVELLYMKMNEKKLD